jgi:hypothetical protein
MGKAIRFINPGFGEMLSVSGFVVLTKRNILNGFDEHRIRLPYFQKYGRRIFVK